MTVYGALREAKGRLAATVCPDVAIEQTCRHDPALGDRARVAFIEANGMEVGGEPLWLVFAHWHNGLTCQETERAFDRAIRATSPVDLQERETRAVMV